MFSTKKFGGSLSRLRKRADMTQSELAEKLNLTRQAISCYEVGDSFPDVSILIEIANIFGVTIDQLISLGNPTHVELQILSGSVLDNSNVGIKNIGDVENIAPLIKPSVLSKLSKGLSTHGIEISSIVRFAEYLNDDGVANLLEEANFSQIDNELLEKLIPLLDEDSKNRILQKILDGEVDWRMIKVLLPHAEYIAPLIEAAVVEGVLPWEALTANREGYGILFARQAKRGSI